MSKFELLNKDAYSCARLGVLTTDHGKVETPVFMPVGTGGAVKGIVPQLLKETGTKILLANAYHLILRPGVDVVGKLGGLHKFMAWDLPILTDSGGYQIFSLGSQCSNGLTDKTKRESLTKVDDNGVEFISHVDGTKIYLDAESAIKIQNRLGADIIMCLDQCTPLPADESLLKRAVDRTIRWAKRARKVHNNPAQLLFAIVQGGTNLQLRSYCASELLKLDFDGYAIGGLSVGEGHNNMVKTATYTTRLLPENLPRYLMGVGTPADIIAAVKAGVDMFDCVLPTRNGRNAYAFTEDGPLRLRNNAYINDPEPVEDGCGCYCCRNFSRAALRYFFNSGEMLGPILLSLHNISFYQRLMAKIRLKLEKNEFAAWADKQLRKYRET